MQTASINLEPVAKQVSDVLRQWIMSGHLPAGEHIRQDAIAEDLGVSRAPVREALLTLEAEGLITRQKYKGAFVAEISLAEVRETYKLRSLLECFLFENALPRITEKDLQRAEKIVHESLATTNSDDWMQLNIDFHMTLYEPSQLTLTMQTLNGLLLRTDRYFRLQQAISPSVQHKSHDEHQEILDIIRSGDHEAAVRLMREHIESNSDEVIQFVEDGAKADPASLPPDPDTP
ncbi:GntR family transcriptional regulator [Elongatibacter sediminis]|uniref:GntR family transcriptional regulator n=1 Tax=Elongatibacter sediminis TaxID=3119006 RepID=A0AAW9RD00_9GAMM